MGEYAIVARLTPAQRRRVRAYAWTLEPDRVLRNRWGQCPLVCALGGPGARGVADARWVADALVGPAANATLYHAVLADAGLFIAAADAGPVGADKTAWVRTVFAQGDHA